MFLHESMCSCETNIHIHISYLRQFALSATHAQLSSVCLCVLSCLTFVCVLSVTCLLKIYALDLVLCCVGSSVSVFISKRSSRFDYYLSTINNISHSTLVCFILSLFFFLCVVVHSNSHIWKDLV